MKLTKLRNPGFSTTWATPPSRCWYPPLCPSISTISPPWPASPTRTTWAYWGYAASIATLLVALSGPVLGTLADYKGFKKPIFLVALIVGALGCVALGLAKAWLAFLVIFVVAKTGYAASLVFYDAMLNDVTDETRVDNVSSLGYAWGYVGSCLPFLLCLGLVPGGRTPGPHHGSGHGPELHRGGPLVGGLLPAPAAALPPDVLYRTAAQPRPQQLWAAAENA